MCPASLSSCSSRRRVSLTRSIIRGIHRGHISCRHTWCGKDIPASQLHPRGLCHRCLQTLPPTTGQSTTSVAHSTRDNWFRHVQILWWHGHAPVEHCLVALLLLQNSCRLVYED